MRRFRPSHLLLFAIVTGCAAVTLAGAGDEQAARRLEARLMAPCCGMNPLAQHYSGPAEEMKRELRGLLAAGRSEEQILDFYVARHGERILALPRPEGFNLLAYGLPGFVLIAGALWVALALRRWRRRPTPVTETPEWTAPSPADAERVRRALERLG